MQNNGLMVSKYDDFMLSRAILDNVTPDIDFTVETLVKCDVKW